MIIFVNEDRAYLTWVTHHRQGFVLDGRRKPRLDHLMIHRATCPAIKSAPSRRFHWTTGAKLKACALDRVELETWATEVTAALPAWCADCQPCLDTASASSGRGRSSKLGREILDYVLDAAVIHLEHEFPPYRLTIGDIAACFAKTPGQLRPAINRLIDEGLLMPVGQGRLSTLRLPQRIVLPTMQALRTLEAFRDESDAAIQSELKKLNVA